MSSQTLTLASPHHHLSLVGGPFLPEPTLSEPDRTDLGNALADLLVDLHWAGSLRPRSVDSAAGPALEISLVVPGAGDLVARIARTAGTFELTISGAMWSELMVLREEGGRLEALYQHYFCSQADQEKAAKEALVQGFGLLRLVKTWGVNQA